jgi:hypothetical protein
VLLRNKPRRDDHRRLLDNPTGKYGEVNFLYRNIGGGRIEDLSARAGAALTEAGRGVDWRWRTSSTTAP